MFICLLRLISKHLTLLLILTRPAAAASSSDASLDSYDHFLTQERALASTEHTGEVIASGAAAVFIGIYGYYNTAPNPLVKLLYAATQTAGVLTMGQAIRNQNHPRLTLEIDDLLRHSSDGKSVDVAALKARIGRFQQKSSSADARTLAYTSSILSTLYFYNGYRETGADHTLRNIYYFLGFNFALGSAVGFYQTLTLEPVPTALSFAMQPLPTITYHF